MSSSDNNNEWDVVRMLEWGTDYFREKGVPSPRLSMEWILSDVLKIRRLDLYLAFDRPLTCRELDAVRPMVKRRAEHEPLQYITGTADFHQLTLRVTPDVLIPRPETEELVERILEDHPPDTARTFLDIGTGSGCIALAVKKARPQWEVTAIDLSEKALEIARQNARENRLDVAFVHTPFEPWKPGRNWDIIASNPPYIHENEIPDLAEQVIKYEPRNALITEDIVDIYRRLADFCETFLTPGGSFYFEINEAHGEALLKTCGEKALKCRLAKDYSNKDRFITGVRS
ncbi:peptide chain release factor N(5)-glutamine methyltransferase [Balneolales bacterium ANBcel1]|nr:peptide chain release factor N(5)-glutamine methyltransferase [Balneolales bacterium ANBcel1]